MSMLFSRIRDFAASHPDQIALRDSSQRISYAELWQQIQSLAEHLSAAKISRLAACRT